MAIRSTVLTEDVGLHAESGRRDAEVAAKRAVQRND